MDLRDVQQVIGLLEKSLHQYFAISHLVGIFSG